MPNILQHPIWTDTGRLPDEKWSKRKADHRNRFWQGCSLIFVCVLQLECLKDDSRWNRSLTYAGMTVWIRYVCNPSQFHSGIPPRMDRNATLPDLLIWLVFVWVATLEPPGRVGHFSWISMLAKAMLCRSTDFPSSDVMVASLSGHSSFQSSLGSLVVCSYGGGGRKAWEIWSHTMTSGRQKVGACGAVPIEEISRKPFL